MTAVATLPPDGPAGPYYRLDGCLTCCYCGADVTRPDVWGSCDECGGAPADPESIAFAAELVATRPITLESRSD